MPHLHITLKENSDETAAFPEITKANFGGELTLDGACILEGGMFGGKSSVGFHLIDPVTGKHYISQTSGELLHGLMSALRGFEQRLSREKGGGL